MTAFEILMGVIGVAFGLTFVLTFWTIVGTFVVATLVTLFMAPVSGLMMVVIILIFLALCYFFGMGAI